MRIHGTALFTLASVLLGGLVATTGCGSAETDDTVGEDVTLPATPAFHLRRHFRGRAGSAGNNSGGGSAGAGSAGTTGTGGVVGPVTGDPIESCDLCTKTQQCCEAVNTSCSFSAATCSALIPLARDAYAHNCLVFLKAIAGAHIGAGVSPPPACR